jgi:outer membrane protein
MMRVIAATVVTSFVIVTSALAQTPPAPTPAPAPPAAAPAQVPFPGDARVGFVNLQAVVQNSQLGRAGQERLKALTDKKTAEIAEKNKEIQTLQQEIQSQQSVLSPTVLAQRNADLDRRNRELQFLQEQAQVDVEALQGELLDDFGKRVMPIVEQIRAERNLWAILSAGDNSGLLSVNPALDLSTEVVRRLDATK